MGRGRQEAATPPKTPEFEDYNKKIIIIIFLPHHLYTVTNKHKAVNITSNRHDITKELIHRADEALGSTAFTTLVEEKSLTQPFHNDTKINQQSSRSTITSYSRQIKSLQIDLNTHVDIRKGGRSDTLNKNEM